MFICFVKYFLLVSTQFYLTSFSHLFMGQVPEVQGVGTAIIIIFIIITSQYSGSYLWVVELDRLIAMYHKSKGLILRYKYQMLLFSKSLHILNILTFS